MMNVLLVDDEPLAQEVLENHISKIPNVEISGKANNALQALEVLQEKEIDLIFLDIQMPELTGIDFLKTLKNPPMVVFTTAYPEFALDGFELDVVDYLLKPISFERFLKAVNKAQEITNLKHQSVSETNFDKNEPDYMFVKADKKIVKIPFADIKYIEGLKDYVMIYTSDKRIITLQTLKHLEENLPSAIFKRVHRSFIVSLDKIKSVVGNSVEIDDRHIPIGKLYRDDLFKLVYDNKFLK